MRSRGQFFLWVIFFAFVVWAMPAHAQGEEPEDLSAPVPAATAPEGTVSTEVTAAKEAIEESGEEEVESDIGFPQLNPDSYVSQVFWLGVSFLLLLTLMSKVALPRVGHIFDSRLEAKNNDLGQAERASEEAAKIRHTYEHALAKAQSNAQESLNTAEKSIKNKIAEQETVFAEQSRKRLVQAEQNIGKAKGDALLSLADISAEAAADMIAKVSGITINKADAKKAVASLMEGKSS